MNSFSKVKAFATAASEAVMEIRATLSQEDLDALNRFLEHGCHVALAFSVNGAGHSEICLDVIEPDGTPHRFLTLNASQLRLA